MVTQSPLSSRKCVPCEGGVSTLTAADLERLHAETPGWEIEEVEGVKRLTRGFVFETIAGLLRLQEGIMETADAEGHHPVMRVSARKRGWKLTVDLWTHKL